MRRIIVSNHMSLDGFFEGPNKEIDWFGFNEELFAYSVDLLNSVDTLLFGRTTYEMMAAYWTSAPPDPIADKMNSLPKIVFSNSLGSLDWNNSRLVKGDVAEEFSRLKQQSGRDMVVLGSATLASSLLQAGLVDEYRVILTPVLLGSGKPLFEGIRQRMELKLAGSRPLASGVVVLTYQTN